MIPQAIAQPQLQNCIPGSTVKDVVRYAFLQL